MKTKLFSAILLVSAILAASSMTSCKKDDPTKEEQKQEESKYEAVDLGLSVKWAAYNVGATSPEQVGLYFAWGETEGYAAENGNCTHTFSKEDYKWYDPSDVSKLTKYGPDIDNKKVLDASDDAATVNWGGAWRMPTEDEILELKDKCTWVWFTQNGVNGYKVISNANGNSIFLPASGYIINGTQYMVGNVGDFWTSSAQDNTGQDYYVSKILSISNNSVSSGFLNRNCGTCVRPVCK